MGCPLCRSSYLEIRQQVGWEWIIKHFTRKRKYRCITCGHSFRAADRRKHPRPPKAAQAKGRTASTGA